METQNVWQVAAGPADRCYADQFLKYGVALIGPGETGPWMPERPDEDFEGSSVRRFATELQGGEDGDVLLLRTGVSTILAVGLVASEYQYLPQFDDVNGWDLSHARRVRWCPLPVTHTFDGKVFGANPRRLARVNKTDVVRYAQTFLRSPPIDWQTAALPALPDEEPPLEDPPTELRDLVAQAHDLVKIYWDAEVFGDWPMEDELVAHYIVPFLRALGWPVERIAVEWRNIDVCVFSALPRTPESCYYLIEAKRLGAGVEGALEQAKGYVSALGVPCDVVVTDGIRYRMYAAEKNFAPVAYANLALLKRPALELISRMRRP